MHAVVQGCKWERMAQLEQERVVGRLLLEGDGLGEELAGIIPEGEQEEHAA